MNAITRPPIPKEETAAQRWARFSPIVTGDDYVNSLRNRGVTVYLFGEKIEEPVDHPIIRPSINALKRTYDLAIEDPALATAYSPLINAQVNR
ncbi:MAG: 4-hydroxyphenylacetate 3-hydroxylase N-terminal domain-containing protein, partial [Spongiibacteraceae bacterium]